MDGQGQLNFTGVPKFTTNFDIIRIPEEIQDEITVINSIYDEGTWKIETTYHDNGSPKIRTRLKPPIKDLTEDGPSLKIVLPSTYPRERPEFKEVGKWNKLPRRDRNIYILVFVAIHELFGCGSVCMYQALEHVLERVNVLDESGRMDVIDTIQSQDVTPGLKNWNGRDIALGALEPYTCCLERIPVSLIEPSLDPEPDNLKRYEQMLVARDMAHPFFCSYFKNCGKLVGGFDVKALRLAASKRGGGVLCRSYGLWSCAKCRTPKHSGDCVSDPDIAKLFETAAIRRCPNCSEVIEKNGGCPHMTCRSCNSHWWWSRTGRLEPFKVYGMHDNDDWLWS